MNYRARSGELKRIFKIRRIGLSQRGGSDGDRGAMERVCPSFGDLPSTRAEVSHAAVARDWDVPHREATTVAEHISTNESFQRWADERDFLERIRR